MNEEERHARGMEARRQVLRCASRERGLGAGAAHPCTGGGLRPTRTQVAIVGAGPAGLTLARLLEQAGIETVVLEARPRDHVYCSSPAAGLAENYAGLELGG